MLEKKRSRGTVKLGTNSTGMVMSHKQGKLVYYTGIPQIA
jgi:hypothetical protein